MAAALDMLLYDSTVPIAHIDDSSQDMYCDELHSPKSMKAPPINDKI